MEITIRINVHLDNYVTPILLTYFLPLGDEYASRNRPVDHRIDESLLA